MPIVRGHHSFDDHYTQIPNSWVRDGRLSFKARGLLVLIMSHKSGWRISVASIAAENKEGKDSIRKAIAELEVHGYLKRDQAHGGDGRFGEAIWVTCDPIADLPLAENPTTDNPTPKNTSTKEEQVKETKSRASRIPADFQITADMRSWATSNHPGVDIDMETLNFIDYWETKPSNNTKLDWVRTWQTWIRNARPKTATQPRQTKIEKQREAKANFLAKFGEMNEPRAIN
jgi:hypothetical protein